MKKTIAKAIKEYRLSHGLTQLDIAIKSGKSIRSIKRYEKGDMVPSINTLEAIFDKPIQNMLYSNLIMED